MNQRWYKKAVSSQNPGETSHIPPLYLKIFTALMFAIYNAMIRQIHYFTFQVLFSNTNPSHDQTEPKLYSYAYIYGYCQSVANTTARCLKHKEADSCIMQYEAPGAQKPGHHRLFRKSKHYRKSISTEKEKNVHIQLNYKNRRSRLAAIMSLICSTAAFKPSFSPTKVMSKSILGFCLQPISHLFP